MNDGPNKSIAHFQFMPARTALAALVHALCSNAPVAYLTLRRHYFKYQVIEIDGTFFLHQLSLHNCFKAVFC